VSDWLISLLIFIDFVLKDKYYFPNIYLEETAIKNKELDYNPALC